MVNSVDRTTFFMSQGNGVSAPDPGQPARAPDDVAFNADADSIYTELERAKSKLAELSQLAKKRSLYVDNTASIEALTAQIKALVTHATGSIDSFEKRVRAFKFRNDHARQHYTNMISQLRNELFEVTKSFKDTLHNRARIMLEQENRRKLYSTHAADDRAWGIGRKRFMLQQDLDSEQQVDLESGVLERPSTSVISDARAEALANVQRAIGELSQIFQRVTSYVTQQDEMINRIDFDSELALDNVKSAKAELLKYYRRISSNRGLVIKVVRVHAQLVLLVIVFLALYIFFFV